MYKLILESLLKQKQKNVFFKKNNESFFFKPHLIFHY